MKVSGNDLWIVFGVLIFFGAVAAAGLLIMAIGLTRLENEQPAP